MQHLQPNTTLQGGKYRTERVLGQGGLPKGQIFRTTILPFRTRWWDIF